MRWLVLLSLPLLGAGSGRALEPDAPKPAEGTPKAVLLNFGSLQTMADANAKAKVAAWLKSQNAFNEESLNKTWSKYDSTFDRTLAVIKNQLPEAAKALDVAADRTTDAPKEVPASISDKKLPSFIRSNLAAAYTKSLAARRVYEEALDAAEGVVIEDVIDPSSFLFYKSVAQHGLIKAEEALASITRLLEDVTDAPDRYKMVATLMYFEIRNWSKDQKDLANIRRLMDNSERRLDLARGGEQTQKIQKKILFRLDEKIKELENQQKGSGGGCPSGGSSGSPGGGTTQPSSPAGESVIMGGSGEGKIDEKELKALAGKWGTLPPAEREKAMQNLTRNLPPKHQFLIQEYFKAINRIHGFDR